MPRAVWESISGHVGGRRTISSMCQPFSGNGVKRLAHRCPEKTYKIETKHKLPTVLETAAIHHMPSAKHALISQYIDAKITIKPLSSTRNCCSYRELTSGMVSSTESYKTFLKVLKDQHPLFNPLSSRSDQRQTSLCNFNVFSVSEVIIKYNATNTKLKKLL